MLMKKLIRYIVPVAAVFMLSFTPAGISSELKENSTQEETEIKWKSFDNSVDLKNQGKKYFIYVYTDWCSWCKRMKSTTFEDEKVINLLNEKFIPVMFNAESNEPIEFNGREYKFIPGGRNGYHELAAALLNNQLSYPSVVFLDEDMNMIQPLPGYKSPEDLSIILTYLGDKIYENIGFEEYYKQQTEG
jgi:thioredoxin-related protein